MKGIASPGKINRGRTIMSGKGREISAEHYKSRPRKSVSKDYNDLIHLYNDTIKKFTLHWFYSQSKVQLCQYSNTNNQGRFRKFCKL